MLDDLTPLSEEERRVALRAVAAIYKDAVAYVLRDDGWVRHEADRRARHRVGTPLGWVVLGAVIGAAATILLASIW